MEVLNGHLEFSDLGHEKLQISIFGPVALGFTYKKVPWYYYVCFRHTL